MKVCPDCFRTVEPSSLPAVKTDVPGRAGVPAFVQVDRKCPGCGALISRKIDDEPVGAKFDDKRAERFAAKAAKADKGKTGAKPAK